LLPHQPPLKNGNNIKWELLRSVKTITRNARTAIMLHALKQHKLVKRI